MEYEARKNRDYIEHKIETRQQTFSGLADKSMELGVSVSAILEVAARNMLELLDESGSPYTAKSFALEAQGEQILMDNSEEGEQ